MYIYIYICILHILTYTFANFFNFSKSNMYDHFVTFNCKR